ncbi:YycC family protein [Cohnella sp. WQ 127256]|uniref:YycC family protein n=1 Tax=Cohnella sp. WQ 127256 TaxID=2938790 RepID=UPI00211862E0|nr:YycC family protein [Cohnella sp. WQ 127256]
MRRMPLSADTAVKLAEYMKVPLEHLMHMPQHILLQKLGEMAKTQTTEQEKNLETEEKKSE